MAFTLKVGTVSKRHNSTYVPTTELSTDLSVVLKDGCSETAPVFVISADSFSYNYCQWGSWYYYITDVEYTRNNLYTVTCRLDALATFKSYVQATTAFVAYDTTANTEISDRRLSTKTTAVRTESVSTDNYEIITHTAADMTVVLNVVGDDACATYITTPNNAKNLLSDVGSWVDDLFDPLGPFTSLEEVGDALAAFFKKMLSSGTAADCIRSAYMLPVKYSLISGSSTDTTDGIVLGEYPTGMQGKVVTQRWLHDGIGVTIPWPTADWRRNSPYTEIYLYIPFVGVLNYPASTLMGAASIYVDFAIDITNGDSLVTVSLDSVGGQVIGQYNVNLAMNYAIGASNVTPVQQITSLATAIGGAAAMMATGGVAAAAIGTGAIVGEFNGMTPVPSSVGGPGGAAVLGLRGGASDGFALRCMTVFHDTTVAPDSVSAAIGTPTNAVKSLSGLTGYVETRNAWVAAPAEYAICEELSAALNNGIYIE